MNDEGLDECPFCGNKNVKLFTEYEWCLGDNGDYVIGCDINEGGCGASSRFSPDPEVCKKAWNRRTK